MNLIKEFLESVIKTKLIYIVFLYCIVLHFIFKYIEINIILQLLITILVFHLILILLKITTKYGEFYDKKTHEVKQKYIKIYEINKLFKIFNDGEWDKIIINKHRNDYHIMFKKDNLIVSISVFIELTKKEFENIFLKIDGEWLSSDLDIHSIRRRNKLEKIKNKLGS